MFIPIDSLEELEESTPYKSQKRPSDSNSSSDRVRHEGKVKIAVSLDMLNCSFVVFFPSWPLLNVFVFCVFCLRDERSTGWRSGSERSLR
jgi:hypothetical protein